MLLPLFIVKGAIACTIGLGILIQNLHKKHRYRHHQFQLHNLSRPSQRVLAISCKFNKRHLVLRLSVCRYWVSCLCQGWYLLRRDSCLRRYMSPIVLIVPQRFLSATDSNAACLRSLHLFHTACIDIEEPPQVLACHFRSCNKYPSTDAVKMILEVLW